MSIQQLNAYQAGAKEASGIPVSNLEKMMQEDSGNIAARGVGKATRNIDSAIDDFDKASKTLFAASDKLHANADELAKRAKLAITRTKDLSAQMSDSMQRMTKVLGGDFESRITQMERLADAMERLCALQQKGQLSDVIAAISK